MYIMIAKLVQNSREYKEIYQSFIKDCLSHTILLASKDKMYAEAFATQIAELLLCTENNRPCGKCNACIKVQKGIHADLYEYGKTKPMTADDANAIISSLGLMPYEGDKKVYVLYNFDEASEIVQNKLLKSLEEPPKSVQFVLLASNATKLLQTVLSRAEKFELAELSPTDISTYLSGLGVANTATISLEACGSLTTAKSLAEGKTASKVYDFCAGSMINLKRTFELPDYITALEKNKDVLEDIINMYEILASDAIKIRLRREDLVFCQPKMDDVKKIAGEFTIMALVAFIDACRNAHKMIDEKAITTNTIDQLILKLLEVKVKCRRQ